MKGLSTFTRRAGLTSLLLAIAVSSWAVQFSTVDDDFNVGTPGWGVTAFAVIQDAVAVTTGTVTVNAGVYTQGFNIDGKDGLTVEGVDRDTVIIQPAVSWAVPPLFNLNAEALTGVRRCIIRVYNSDNTTIKNMTVDGINTMHNLLYMVFLSESTGYLVENVTIKNNHVADTLGGYSEIGFRASTRYALVSDQGFSCANRAVGTFRNCLAENVGRVYFYTGGWTDTLIEGCTAINDPALDEFGYGMEIGNFSQATVRNCVFSGFGTPALSDNSSVAAVYVENNFTNGYTCTKEVTVEGCTMTDGQIGVWLGSSYAGAGVAGSLEIILHLLNNTMQNNIYGMIVTDQNAQNGSSVSLDASGNNFIDNDIGILVFSDSGDAPVGSHNCDITTTFTRNNISGSDVAIQTEVGSGPGTSNFDLNFSENNLFNNIVDVDHNLPGVPLNTEGTWWGDETGPGPGDITGTGSGDVGAGSPSVTPLTSDDDDDGLVYNQEDLNLNGAVDPGETDPLNPDTDGDGIIDGIDPDPLTPAAYTDADGDGQAAELGDTNDSNPDRDGDGFLDGYEVAYGTDPDNASSKPDLGDVNHNDKVDNVDAVITFAAFLGNTEYGLWGFDHMDVDDNGIIDNVDAVLLLNFFLKNVTLLPIR